MERHLKTCDKNAIGEKKGKSRLYLAEMFWGRVTFWFGVCTVQVLAILEIVGVVELGFCMCLILAY